MEVVNRTIALANFYGDGKHLYQDELGWWTSVKEEAHSQISRDIFEYEIVPIEFKILPVVRKSRRPSLAAKLPAIMHTTIFSKIKFYRFRKASSAYCD